jgi:hypothetical protein
MTVAKQQSNDSSKPTIEKTVNQAMTATKQQSKMNRESSNDSNKATIEQERESSYITTPTITVVIERETIG